VGSERALSLALTARTFGQRPSDLIGVPDPVVALVVDEALALRLMGAGEDESGPDPKTGVQVAPESAYDD
jgi:hypothetical protein